MGDTIQVSVPESAKKNDTIATILGAGQAAMVGTLDFFGHLGPDGLRWKEPTFWLGLFIAALAGVQGYYSNKGTGTQVVAQPQGLHPTVNVDVAGPPKPPDA